MDTDLRYVLRVKDVFALLRRIGLRSVGGARLPRKTVKVIRAIIDIFAGFVRYIEVCAAAVFLRVPAHEDIALFRFGNGQGETFVDQIAVLDRGLSFDGTVGVAVKDDDRRKLGFQFKYSLQDYGFKIS